MNHLGIIDATELVDKYEHEYIRIELKPVEKIPLICFYSIAERKWITTLNPLLLKLMVKTYLDRSNGNYFLNYKCINVPKIELFRNGKREKDRISFPLA
jgi:hypothetical protein